MPRHWKQKYSIRNCYAQKLDSKIFDKKCLSQIFYHRTPPYSTGRKYQARDRCPDKY